MTDSTPSTVFMDLDDVLCLNSPYGGSDVKRTDRPPDLFRRLFHPPAVETLRLVALEYQPRFVITSSWLRFLGKEGFETLFARTGMGFLALHEHWDAPEDRGMTRLQAVERWLRAHHHGEAFVVLDDHASGTGLEGSTLDRAGRVVLCEVDVGLHLGHLPAVRQALLLPSRG